MELYMYSNPVLLKLSSVLNSSKFPLNRLSNSHEKYFCYHLDLPREGMQVLNTEPHRFSELQQFLSGEFCILVA